MVHGAQRQEPGRQARWAEGRRASGQLRLNHGGDGRAQLPRVAPAGQGRRRASTPSAFPARGNASALSETCIRNSDAQPCSLSEIRVQISEMVQLLFQLKAQIPDRVSRSPSNTVWQQPAWASVWRQRRDSARRRRMSRRTSGPVGHSTPCSTGSKAPWLLWRAHRRGAALSCGWRAPRLGRRGSRACALP